MFEIILYFIVGCIIFFAVLNTIFKDKQDSVVKTTVEGSLAGAFIGGGCVLKFFAILFYLAIISLPFYIGFKILSAIFG